MLIRCAECNTVFEDSQTVCPNCGKEIIKESTRKDTEVQIVNWWTKGGSIIFTFVAIFMLLISVVLFVSGMYLMSDLLKAGFTLSISGVICFVISIILFVIVYYSEKNYGFKRSKPNKREQEEYEQLIRDFLNSNQ